MNSNFDLADKADRVTTQLPANQQSTNNHSTVSPAQSMADKVSSIQPETGDSTVVNSHKIVSRDSSSSITVNQTAANSSETFQSKTTTKELIQVVAPLLNPISSSSTSQRQQQASYLNQMRQKGVIQDTPSFNSHDSQQKLTAEINFVHHLIEERLLLTSKNNQLRSILKYIIKDNDPFELPLAQRINLYCAVVLADNYQNSSLHAEKTVIGQLSDLIVNPYFESSISLNGITQQNKMIDLIKETQIHGWQTIQGKRFYYNADGHPVKGWQIINGKRYYFDPINSELSSGCRKINDQVYSFDPFTGVLKTGFQQINQKTIYSNSVGQVQFGWQSIAGRRYFFNLQTGAMMTGLVKFKFEKTTYFFKPSGEQAFGPQKINQHEYLFDQTTGKMLTGLHYLPSEKKVVYYDETGKLIYQKASANFLSV
jgi:hypothetical protein